MPADFFFFFFFFLATWNSINLPSFTSTARRRETIDERRARWKSDSIEPVREGSHRYQPSPSLLSVLSALDAETQPPRGFSSADLSYLEIPSCRPINIYQLSAPSVSWCGHSHSIELQITKGLTRIFFNPTRSVIRFDEVWRECFGMKSDLSHGRKSKTWWSSSSLIYWIYR